MNEQATGCPFKSAAEINFMDPVVQENWFPAYDVLRETATVLKLDLGRMEGKRVVALLQAGGVARVTVARMDAGDVAEDAESDA